MNVKRHLKKKKLIMFLTNSKELKLFLVLFISANAYSQTKNDPESKWAVSTSIILSGSSDLSDPSGYKVYGALSIEPSVERKLVKSLYLSFKFRTESHEIDYQMDENSVEIPLGSVELIPLNLLLKYSIPLKGIRPYAAAGGNATFCWEKSGILNSTDLSTSLGAALAFGVDVDLSSLLIYNFNFGWNSMRTDITNDGVTIAKLTMDPVLIGMGIGFKF